jgi:peptidoglycan-associated lipoprotein
MNRRFSTLTRLALAGLASLSIAACATKKPPPPQPAPPPPPQAQQAPPETPEAPAPQPAAGPVPGSEQDFVINVGELIYFDFDKSDIRPDAQPVLTGQADWLRRWPDVKVRIEGSCDERGTREYNFALGGRRAEAVRQFLINHGVAAGRITTISYGKERPIDPGSDEQAWARNRNARTAIAEGGATGR